MHSVCSRRADATTALAATMSLDGIRAFAANLRVLVGSLYWTYGLPLCPSKLERSTLV
jgi:hypothetical protein